MWEPTPDPSGDSSEDQGGSGAGSYSTDEIGTAIASLAARLNSKPVLSWRAAIQPRPLQRARVVVGERRTYAYTEKGDTAYRDELRTLWALAGLREPLQGPLAVLMTFAGSSRGPTGRATRRQPDATNLLKAVEDAGNGFLWGDDRQIQIIVGAIVAWGPAVVPHVTVDVWRLP